MSFPWQPIDANKIAPIEFTLKEKRYVWKSFAQQLCDNTKKASSHCTDNHLTL